MAKSDLSHLAAPGTVLELRVTPKASRNEIREEEGQIRVYVTTVPENGKANEAVIKLLSKALGCRSRGSRWSAEQRHGTRPSGWRGDHSSSSAPCLV